jgi:hypothetical protein
VYNIGGQLIAEYGGTATNGGISYLASDSLGSSFELLVRTIPMPGDSEPVPATSSYAVYDVTIDDSRCLSVNGVLSGTELLNRMAEALTWPARIDPPSPLRPRRSRGRRWHYANRAHHLH